MSNASISFRLLTGFDDPLMSPGHWNALVRSGPSDVIFLTYQYQKAWWQTFGRGQLLLTAALKGGEVIAIAPLFADGNMIFFVGSGGSDYLDFIGDLSKPELLEGLLLAAASEVDGFLGYRFYHVPERSISQVLLHSFTGKQPLDFYQEETWPCPLMDLRTYPLHAQEAMQKKSLLRHQGWFERSALIESSHLTDGRQILHYLDDFFDQHIRRWAVTEFPSLFHDEKQRAFYRTLTKEMAETGWLCFTKIGWQGQTIAYHFGFFYQGSFLWYKPTFEIELSKHGPGEVLIRQLLLYAIEQEAHTFDFGMGDEAFKKRFATDTLFVRTIGLYPKQGASNVN
jgi:CelD/BcsL family acetyltransferase involved in cellulose biosynthesis